MNHSSSSPPPQVSVVIGVYNGSERLRDTIESVLSQAECALEVIVVDDGSTDGSAATLEVLTRSDSRVRTIHQPNRGLTRALVAGCAVARGRFIARQDVGDVSLPGRLLHQSRALEQDADLAFVSCGSEFIEPGGALLFKNAGTGRAHAPRHVIDLREPYGMSDGPSHHGSVMFRRDTYVQAGGYRPQFYFGQDWDLWFRLAQLGKFQMLPQTLYRADLGIGDISTSHKPLQEQLAHLSLKALHHRIKGESESQVLEQAARIRPVEGRQSQRRSVASGSYFIGECLRRNGNYDRAREYFLRSVRNAPWQMKAWVRLAQSAIKHRG